MNKETNIYSFADECYVFYGDYKKDIEERDKEIERLNNIIKGIESYCNMTISMNFNMNNSKLQEQIVEDYTNVLNKLKKLKDSDNNVKKINTNNN